MWTGPHGLVATSLATAPPARVVGPASLSEALAALAEPGAVVVAGGTDLCAGYNEGATPSVLVSLDRVPGLDAITVGDGEIRIGAAVTHAAGSADPALRRVLPGFAAAWAMIANPRVRYRGTIGGNLMARRTRYEMSLLLTALDATLRFARADGGSRDATPADLWEDRLHAPALLHHVAIPLRPGLRFRYQRALRPQLTLAVARHDGGGRAAIGTEWLRPQPVALDDAALAGLPEAFTDPVISNWYARRAGATLLRRGLEALDAA